MVHQRRRPRPISLLVSLLVVPAVVGAFHVTKLDPNYSVFGATRKSVVSTIASAAAANNDDDWWFNDSSSDNNKNNNKKKPNKLDEAEIMMDLASKSNSNNNKKKDAEIQTFLDGTELQQLRTDLEWYRENLKWATAVDDHTRVVSLRRVIDEKELRDPEIVYNKARALIAEAEGASRSVLAPNLREEVIAYWIEQGTLARSCLPRFQMEGLWMGNYGEGPELVNITYAGDTLMANKVTGDDSVPRGEVSFTANLSPPPLNISNAPGLSSEQDTEEYTILQRKFGESIFPGEGQLAKQDFKDNHFASGVFIAYDTHRFSFSWVPTKHHVFFARPSPHETIRLLRDVISDEDEVENMRDHVARCYAMEDIPIAPSSPVTHQCTTRHEPTEGGSLNDPFRRIHRQSDLELLRSRVDADSKGGGSIFQFMRLNKWKNYIDRVLLGKNDDGLHTTMQ